MPRRRTCSYCKAVRMNYENGTNKDNGNYQVGCNLGYKLEMGPEYVHQGSTRDSFINNLYPCENCPKPTTWQNYLTLYDKSNRSI